MKFLIIPILFLVFISSIFPQEKREGKIGVGLDGVNTSNMILKYFNSDEVAYELILGMDFYKIGSDSAEKQHNEKGKEFTSGVSVLYHFSESAFSPLFGLEGLYHFRDQIFNYDNKESAKHSFKCGVILGGEYFMAKQFSIGIKEKIYFGFGLPESKSEGSDLRCKTYSCVTARFYFN